MDYKTLKQDLTYCLKRFQKEGKILSSYGDNLEIVDEKFVLSGNTYDPLEALVLVKGYAPTEEHLRTYYSKWVDEFGLFGTPGITYEHSYRHYEAYNLSLIDLLIKETSVIKDDWYAFLDGFDNVIFSGKNEFYNVGIYIREKFVPFEVRAETLIPPIYEANLFKDRTPMKKFVVHTIKGKTSIVEAECYQLTPLDGVFVDIKPGEYCCRITAPEFLFEKKKDGSLGSATFHSHSLFNSLDAARAQAEQDIRAGFERALRKQNVLYTEEDVQAKLVLVQVILL